MTVMHVLNVQETPCLPNRANICSAEHDSLQAANLSAVMFAAEVTINAKDKQRRRAI